MTINRPKSKESSYFGRIKNNALVSKKNYIEVTETELNNVSGNASMKSDYCNSTNVGVTCNVSKSC